MTDNQLDILVDKLEELRCCLIDIEEAIEKKNNSKTDFIVIKDFKKVFFDRLELKTGCGRNEIKAIVEEILN